MRFHTVVALSALSLGATTSAMPVLNGRDYSIQVARDLDSLQERDLVNALERRGWKMALAGGALAGFMIHKVMKKMKTTAPPPPQAGAPPNLQTGPERRDLEDALDTREFWDVDDLDTRDLDVLERRLLGKLLLGAAGVGLVGHELNKYQGSEPNEPRDLDALEGRGLGKALALGAGAGFLIHEWEKHEGSEASHPERRWTSLDLD